VNTRFSINFRSEAIRREAVHARRRTLMLAAWLSCLGALVLLIGYYGLNWMSLVNRVRQLERRTVAIRALREHNAPWEGGPAEIGELQRYAVNPRQWRDRLAWFAEIVPANVRVTRLALDPSSASATGRPALVLTGEARGDGRQDHLQGVMELVSTMRGDSVFTAEYPNVRLVSTRFQTAPGARTEFVIECH
jgi:hypothetical protein